MVGQSWVGKDRVRKVGKGNTCVSSSMVNRRL